MRKFIATALLVVVFATGCTTTFDREGSIDELIGQGLNREQATCAVDEMVDEFGEEKLMSDDEPSAADEEILFEIMADCLVG